MRMERGCQHNDSLAGGCRPDKLLVFSEDKMNYFGVPQPLHKVPPRARPPSSPPPLHKVPPPLPLSLPTSRD